MSRSSKSSLKRVAAPFVDTSVRMPWRISARWSDDPLVGSCNGCGVHGKVAVIRGLHTEVRYCVECVNSINQQLGAFR